MSTRYMKKVYGNDIIGQNDNEHESEVEIEHNSDIKSKSFNVFDVLNQNSESEGHKDDDQDVANDSYVEENKRKKKKKKRKKCGAVNNQQKEEVEDNENIDEIDRTIREVNKLLGEPLPGCSTQKAEETQWVVQKSQENILCIQHKHLNPYNELKRIFGSKTVQAEQSKRRSKGRLKKTWLVSPRDNWSLVGKSGLSMAVDNTMPSSPNTQYFVYEHNPFYRQTQLKFLQAVESLNPENIINIINIHPYHVDTLLQLAELCKVNEDLPMAAEFTEKALYYLECAFHPSFNVTTAQCRLDYRKQTNRAFFITLFKHLCFVGGRACHRTSLEFCKLLLSLDPEGDPLAVVLFIDFYALKAKEYDWFVEFCNLLENTRNLTQLPNIAYSLALSHFHIGNRDVANQLLQNALSMFPGVLMALLDKCSIQPDSKVMSHSFFNGTAISTTSPALEKLQNLYVVRSFHLWKEAHVLPWLEENVHLTLEIVEKKDSYVKYCQVKRSKRYQGKLPKNILRHIILSDIKEVTVNAQEIQNEWPVLSHDPLPPMDSIDIYTRPVANRQTIQTNSNLFSLFFSSLFRDIDGEIAAAALNAFNIEDENEEHA